MISFPPPPKKGYLGPTRRYSPHPPTPPSNPPIIFPTQHDPSSKRASTPEPPHVPTALLLSRIGAIPDTAPCSPAPLSNGGRAVFFPSPPPAPLLPRLELRVLDLSSYSSNPFRCANLAVSSTRKRPPLRDMRGGDQGRGLGTRFFDCC